MIDLDSWISFLTKQVFFVLGFNKLCDNNLQGRCVYQVYVSQ